MYLGYSLVAQSIPNSLGIKDFELLFYTIATNGMVKQPRGLFIPLGDNSDELLMAINNGAVAAVWEADRVIPAFTPNHFPIFLTKNIKEDVKNMLELYLENIKQNKEMNQLTHFSDLELLNEKLKTYDKSDIMHQIVPLVQKLESLRRG